MFGYIKAAHSTPYLTKQVKKEFTELKHRAQHGQTKGLTEAERYAARRLAFGGIVKSSGIKQFGKGVIEYSRERGQELADGLNIGRAADAAAKLEKKAGPMTTPTSNRKAQHDQHKAAVKLYHRSFFDREEVRPSGTGSAGNATIPGAQGVASTAGLEGGWAARTGNTGGSVPAANVHKLGSMARSSFVFGTSADQPGRTDHGEHPVTIAPASPSPTEEPGVPTLPDPVPPPRDVQLPDMSAVDRDLPLA